MGTDIHGFIQVYDYGWRNMVNIGEIGDRDYDLFAYLFGVRNYSNYKPHFANRGFPDEFNDEKLKEMYIEGYYHSVTYVNYNELKELSFTDINDKEDKDDMKSCIKYYLKFMEALAVKYDPDSIRMIVWFDS